MKSEALATYILVVKESLEQTNFANDRQVYERYLVELAVILAKLVNKRDVGEDLNRYERLLGHTWLQDEGAAKSVSEEWNKYKRG